MRIHSANNAIFQKFLAAAEGDLEVAQKLVRDYAKKMMGRLVFLQFLQKKRWLGVDFEDDNRASGDTNFVCNLFASSSGSEQDDFLEAVLEPLFFGMLNTPQEERAARFAQNKWNADLLRRFKKIPYLNGGPFAEDGLDRIKIKFPKELFCNPGKAETERKFLGKGEGYDYKASCGLLDFFGRYNFTIDESDPSDVEVGVDPEMLGKIFENLLEDNKDKGAFYTPKEIVGYMCRESLSAYLENACRAELAPEAVHSFVENPCEESAARFGAHELAVLNQRLKAVKICAPAVGSGAFPMGLLNLLFACRHAINERLRGGEKLARAEIKKEIVKSNIYGVDIEKGAVDIARLRFWLAIVVDSETPEPLPNLDYKIMQGNSLIESYSCDYEENFAVKNYKRATKTETIDLSEIMKAEKQAGAFDFDGNQDIKDLEEALKGYYEPDNETAHKKILQILKVVKEADESEKEAIKRGIKEKVLEIISKRGFAGGDRIINKFREMNIDANSEFFLWHIWFSDVFNNNGGFDIVIGNPPYIQIKWLPNKIELRNANFDSFESTGDIYCLFYEQATKLLKHNGIGCYITSNKWLRSSYGNKLRNYLLNNTNPFQLVDLGSGVFESATVDTNILLWSVKKYLNTKCSNSISNISFVEQTFKLNENWGIQNTDSLLIKNKAEKIKTTLKDFSVKLNYGILTGANKAFILNKEKAEYLLSLDEKNNEVIKPILRGQDLIPYGKIFAQMYILNLHNGVKNKGIRPVDIKNYPTLEEYLNTFGEDFKNRGEQGDNWWNLRNCAYILDYESPKILYSDIVQDKGKFYYDEEKYYTNDTAFMITGKNLKFLVAILNSKIFTYLYKNFYSGGGLGNKGLRYKKEFLEKVPIPVTTQALQFEIIALVDKILVAKKSALSSNTSELERQINVLVYKLYGLSEEEIVIVEK